MQDSAVIAQSKIKYHSHINSIGTFPSQPLPLGLRVTLASLRRLIESLSAHCGVSLLRAPLCNPAQIQPASILPVLILPLIDVLLMVT